MAVNGSSRGRRIVTLLAVLIVAAAMPSVLLAGSAAAQSYVPISGSGSTWSSNALDEWRKNVGRNYGITVNYAPYGSTSGRNDFRNGQADFAVSEIPYGLSDGGTVDQPPARGFGYMPIVAGGTSFMYNLKIANKRVTNLRLSGETITKMFTQKITSWDAPEIKADNPGLALPPRKIVPVVYSNGSGTVAQFTAWMASQHGALWDDYCHRNNRPLTPCGFTSFYPLGPEMEAKPQSQGVSGFVAQDSSEGAITFVEYSYARNAGFPVAKVLNQANYYVEPKAGSVAVALLNAKIAPDLTQDLSQVYVNPDPRTYPLSSYSYMIIPKDTTANFSDAKGATLSEFAAYFLCEGQQQADVLGYSPLPINLVQAGVDQINQIPNSTRKLNRDDLRRCNNPTVSPDGGNRVANEAPQPSPCDRKGAPEQCTTGTGGAKEATPPSGGNNSGGNNASANNSGGGNSGSTSGTNSGNNNPGGNSSAAIDPATGAPLSAPDTGQVVGGAALASSSGASAVPVSVDVADNRRHTLLAVLTSIVLLGLVFGPPLVAYTMRRREGPSV